jgi:ATP-binding cassette subfamily B protein
VDRILVFEQGRLVEQGTYDELLKQQGMFHRLHTIATSSSLRQIKLEEAGFA